MNSEHVVQCLGLCAGLSSYCFFDIAFLDPKNGGTTGKHYGRGRIAITNSRSEQMFNNFPPIFRVAVRELKIRDHNGYMHGYIDIVLNRVSVIPSLKLSSLSNPLCSLLRCFLGIRWFHSSCRPSSCVLRTLGGTPNRDPCSLWGSIWGLLRDIGVI